MLFDKKLGHHVVTLIEVDKNNRGARMSNIGLGMATLGIILAIAGNKLTTNAIRPEVIIGDDKVKDWFTNLVRKA